MQISTSFFPSPLAGEGRGEGAECPTESGASVRLLSAHRALRCGLQMIELSNINVPPRRVAARWAGRRKFQSQYNARVAQFRNPPYRSKIR